MSSPAVSPGDVAAAVRTPRASVTERVLGLLAAFDQQHRRLSLTELAERSGLPLPTAHRLVGELVAWGALVRDAQGRYVIGRRVWDLGLLSPVGQGLRDVAEPYLHDLYGAIRATVHLAVRDGLLALYLDRVAGTSTVPVVSSTGGRLPMHATGVGKVLLAHAPEPVRREVMTSLDRLTPYTVSQPGRLRRQLDQVVRNDYAVTIEEMTLGACSLAVPVRQGDTVVAALGVVVPRLDQNQMRLVAALQVTARGIGRSLGR